MVQDCVSKAVRQSENPGLGPRSAQASLSSFNGLTVLMHAGTRSQQDTYVPVYNQINRFRDQYSSAAGREEPSTLEQFPGN